MGRHSGCWKGSRGVDQGRRRSVQEIENAACKTSEEDGRVLGLSRRLVVYGGRRTRVEEMRDAGMSGLGDGDRGWSHVLE
jgi:hypothetical protein